MEDVNSIVVFRRSMVRQLTINGNELRRFCSSDPGGSFLGTFWESFWFSAVLDISGWV